MALKEISFDTMKQSSSCKLHLMYWKSNDINYLLKCIIHNMDVSKHLNLIFLFSSKETFPYFAGLNKYG